MQKQLEAMLQTEERRKFLGTDSSKVPFGIVVQLRKYQFPPIGVNCITNSTQLQDNSTMCRLMLS